MISDVDGALVADGTLEGSDVILVILGGSDVTLGGSGVTLGGLGVTLGGSDVTLGGSNVILGCSDSIVGGSDAEEGLTADDVKVSLATDELGDSNDEVTVPGVTLENSYIKGPDVNE